MADHQLGRDAEAWTVLANCRQVMAEYFKTSFPAGSEIKSFYKYVAGIGPQFRNSFQTLGHFRKLRASGSLSQRQ